MSHYHMQRVRSRRYAVVHALPEASMSWFSFAGGKCVGLSKAGLTEGRGRHGLRGMVALRPTTLTGETVDVAAVEELTAHVADARGRGHAVDAVARAEVGGLQRRPVRARAVSDRRASKQGELTDYHGAFRSAIWRAFWKHL